MSNLSYLFVLLNKTPEIPQYDSSNLDYYAHLDLNPHQESPQNLTQNAPKVELGLEFENDDASWIMASSFMIFTMQTGFGLMESGMCHMKNEVNILMTNVIDVGLGGYVFWAFGYGLAFGDNENFTTPYYSVGKFFYSPNVNEYHTGKIV